MNVRDRIPLPQEKERPRALRDIAPWNPGQRGLPIEVAKSALFTVRHPATPRRALNQELIFAIPNELTVHYTGVELRAADDLLVWLQVLEYAKDRVLGEPVRFSLYALCKDLGWPTNGKYYEKCRGCLARLQGTSLWITAHSKRIARGLSFLHSVTVVDTDTARAKVEVTIDPHLARLFSDKHARVIWEPYRSLSPTARRLYDYLASHPTPHPIRLETLREMFGSDSERMNKWREQIRRACGELLEHGLAEAAYVEGNLCHLKRP